MFKSLILRIKYFKAIIREKFNTSGNKFFAEIILKKIKQGTYLDCGCYHPFKGSQTKYLYDSGWKGTCIDISCETVKLFKIFRPKDLNLNIGLSTETKKQYAYFEKNISEISSLDKNYLSLIGRKVKFKRKIQVMSLRDLRKKFSLDKINFLKIDCENVDEQIILKASYKDLDADFLSLEYLPKMKDTNNKKRAEANFLELLKKSKVYKKLSKKYKIINYFDYTFLFQKKI